jgi:hypothetical protein
MYEDAAYTSNGVLTRRDLALTHVRVSVKRTVVGANLCVWGPLEVKGKGIKGVGGVADKEAYTVHTINIISQRLYFVARCLIPYVNNAFGLCVFVFLLPTS